MNASALRKNLIELLRGGAAHVTPEASLDGLKPENRHRRPARGLRTIWEELEHIRIAQADILRYTLDSSYKSLEFPREYWPAPKKRITDKEWAATVSGFYSDLDRLVRLVTKKRLDLTARIPHGEGRTYLREVLLAADHNAYHFGQIVAIRKLLGDWPG
ncbi:MAG TPA: DinB family protein [Blastocatellia bacterium]|nr:DinB family protein [Blastocatellia bacterium]